MSRYHNSPFECRVCGTKVAAAALSCPQCGADNATGLRGDTWESDASSELGFFDEEGFDYDDFLTREFGRTKDGTKVREIHFIWWIAGIVLLLSLLIGAFFFPW